MSKIIMALGIITAIGYAYIFITDPHGKVDPEKTRGHVIRYCDNEHTIETLDRISAGIQNIKTREVFGWGEYGKQ